MINTNDIKFAMRIVWDEDKALINNKQHVLAQAQKEADEIFKKHNLNIQVPGRFYTNLENQGLNEYYHAFENAVIELNQLSQLYRLACKKYVYSSLSILKDDLGSYPFFDKVDSVYNHDDGICCDRKTGQYINRLYISWKNEDEDPDYDKKKVEEARDILNRICLDYGFQILEEYKSSDSNRSVYAEPRIHDTTFDDIRDEYDGILKQIIYKIFKTPQIIANIHGGCYYTADNSDYDENITEMLSEEELSELINTYPEINFSRNFAD